MGSYDCSYFIFIVLYDKQLLFKSVRLFRFTGATGRAFLFNKVINLKYRSVIFIVVVGHKKWQDLEMQVLKALEYHFVYIFGFVLNFVLCAKLLIIDRVI